MAETQETPVEEASLTSHLQGLRLSEEAEAREPETVDDSDLKLPRTLAETHALLTQVRMLPIASKREDLVKQSKLTKIRAHLHALSQGPVSKPITIAGQSALAKSSADHANEIHLTLLSRTDRIVSDRLAADALTISQLQKQIEALTKKDHK